MSDTPDTPEKPDKRKGSKIKLALFLPWDENGRLFNPDKYQKPEDEPPPNDKILKFPDESPKDDDA